MRKFTRVEGTAKVVSLEAHKAIQTELSKLAKTSARELSVNQRQALKSLVDAADPEC